MKQIQNKIESDEKFDKIFKAIKTKEIKLKQHIFYDGQIFDAYIFINNIIKSVFVFFSKLDANIKSTDIKRFKKLGIGEFVEWYKEFYKENIK